MPEAFGAYIKSEAQKWTKVIREAGINETCILLSEKRHREHAPCRISYEPYRRCGHACARVPGARRRPRFWASW